MKLAGQIAEKGLQAIAREHPIREGHKIPQIWIVVADSEKAHIFRKVANGIERIGEVSAAHDRSGAYQHGHDVHQEKERHQTGAFPARLAALLDEADRERAFERLVLIAEAHTLVELTSALSPHTQMRIMHQFYKDLTKMADKEVEEHVHDMLGF